MNIWLLTIGEPVPIGAGLRDRLHRTGSFARYLASQGHQVLWWTSAFDHVRKRHLTNVDAIISDHPGLRIRLLRGCGYSRNLSIARYLDHIQIARKFFSLSFAEAVPDIIVSALPTVELCLAGIAYGTRTGVPAVLDLRDMWPDIFVDAVPHGLGSLARPMLEPLFRLSRRACSSANALIGITEAFVEWGLERARRPRRELDRAFPLAYSPEAPSAQEIRAAEEFWDAEGVRAQSPQRIVCYLGNIGLHLDLFHVIKAAHELSQHRRPVRFILCGVGERLEEYRKLADGLPNVLLPGWMDRARMHVLMRRSAVGLDPLPERYDYLASINNKAIEYMSAGLPVLSSPRHGVLSNLLDRHACGLSYDSNDSSSLCGCLQSVIVNPGQIQQMGANALSLFHKEFSADSVHPAMAAHLTRIRDEHQGRHAKQRS